MIINHGRIEWAKALVRMQATDVLLLIQNSDDFSSETIPSKFYEYLLTHRPLLALIHSNPELASTITARGGQVCSATDVGEIKTAILDALQCWERGERQ